MKKLIIVSTLVPEKVLLSFNGDDYQANVPCGTMESISLAIREKLKITSSMKIEFLDPEFEAFVVLEDPKALPSE